MPSNNLVLDTQHVGLTVNSLDTALEFWCEVMGFELAARRSLGSGPAMENIVGVPGVDLDIAIVVAPGGLRIELLEYLSPDDRQVYRPRSCDVGSVHIAFGVSDLDQMLTRVEAAGWNRLGVPQSLPNGTRVMYVRGPEGHTLELMQLATASDPAS